MQPCYCTSVPSIPLQNMLTTSEFVVVTTVPSQKTLMTNITISSGEEALIDGSENKSFKFFLLTNQNKCFFDFIKFKSDMKKM
jgi:hypothetical protein